MLQGCPKWIIKRHSVSLLHSRIKLQSEQILQISSDGRYWDNWGCRTKKNHVADRERTNGRRTAMAKLRRLLYQTWNTLHDSTIHNGTIHDSAIHDSTIHDGTIHDSTKHDINIQGSTIHDSNKMIVQYMIVLHMIVKYMIVLYMLLI